MSFGLPASPGWAEMVANMVPRGTPPAGELSPAAFSPGVKYVLLVLASRLPAVGGIVYDNEQEFIDEMVVRTGVTEKQVRGALKQAAELGWFNRRRVVGRGHVDLEPTIPQRIGQGFKVRRVERGEAPRVVYAIQELSVEAVKAALREADEESGQTEPDVEPGSAAGLAAGGSAGSGVDEPRDMAPES